MLFILQQTILVLLALVNISEAAEGKIMSTNTPVYCGKEGGYQPIQYYKFPIETRSKARAALTYAYWAPNPEGIHTCVCRHYPDFPSCKKEKE